MKLLRNRPFRPVRSNVVCNFLESHNPLPFVKQIHPLNNFFSFIKWCDFPSSYLRIKTSEGSRVSTINNGINVMSNTHKRKCRAELLLLCVSLWTYWLKRCNLLCGLALDACNCLVCVSGVFKLSKSYFELAKFFGCVGLS